MKEMKKGDLRGPCPQRRSGVTAVNTSFQGLLAYAPFYSMEITLSGNFFFSKLPVIRRVVPSRGEGVAWQGASFRGGGNLVLLIWPVLTGKGT